MATTSRAARRRAIRVHGAEVSTERDSLMDYAEAFALLLAVTAVLVAAWIAARPSEGAELTQPAPDTAPISQMQVPNATTARLTDILQPIPTGPTSTEAPGIDASGAVLPVPAEQTEAIAG